MLRPPCNHVREKHPHLDAYGCRECCRVWMRIVSSTDGADLGCHEVLVFPLAGDRVASWDAFWGMTPDDFARLLKGVS